MSDFNNAGFISPNDSDLTEQMFTNDFTSYTLNPYDMNYEIISENLTTNNKEDLKPDHIITILTDENEKIILILNNLKIINESLLKIKEYSNAGNVFKKLISLTESLVEAESHHHKKEAILFPELEKRGVIGSIYLLRIEKEEIRKYIRMLKDLLLHLDTLNYSDSAKKINAIIQLINLKFRKHIKKEYFIIFPLALKIIKDTSTWHKVKNECLNL